MMSARARWSTCVLTMILIVSASSRAQAQDTVTTTTPTDNPTWIAGNGASVAATVTGPAMVSTMRVTIYNQMTRSDVYYSNTSNYTNPWFINFTCPSAIKGQYVKCDCYVEAIAANGRTILGTCTTTLTIYTPP